MVRISSICASACVTLLPSCGLVPSVQQLKDVSSQRKDVSINSSMKTGTNNVQTCDGKQPD